MNIKLCTINDLLEMAYFFECRFEVFSSRLKWNVPIHNGKEYDQYDNSNAEYITVFEDNEILASVRMIETRYSHLLSGSFQNYFTYKNNAPVEATRFFVRKKIKHCHDPICQILFAAMIEYCMEKKYNSIIAIVGSGMNTLLNRYGWEHGITEAAIIENHPTYLINLPVSLRLCRNIKEKALLDPNLKFLSIHQEGLEAQL
ncbi:acyl-homoserine-lactone synthase [Martelella alba]|uniref:Acyl-homoserine-lactone synthase n=1 Tax=Martelella alba TaxID=2590451 RepID=A0ABY2SDH2_9HYPH|nr:acyl-homoserine-lactone synthase [Martelella alba]TKI02503.1 hypothetical protein FCN80_24815 [Martelella alba]